MPRSLAPLLAAALFAPAHTDLLGDLAALESDLEGVGRSVGDTGKSVADASKAVADEVGPALATAGANSVGAVEGLKEKGERLEIGTLLQASGRCPELYANLAELRDHLCWKLAEAFQQSEASPSESPAACKEVGGAYMQRLASESLKDCGELEHFAVQPLVDEALKITCTDGLVEALQELEPQRNDATEYTVRAKQKLMDVALTDTVILQELEEFCGSPPESVAVERLFSVGQLVPWKASGSWGAALALSAAVGLLAAAVAAVAVVRLRRQLQATGCVGCASEVERGLTAVAE